MRKIILTVEEHDPETEVICRSTAQIHEEVFKSCYASDILLKTFKDLKAVVKKEFKKEVAQQKRRSKEASEDLWDADPDCEHNIVSAMGGGIKCTKCRGWCCL